ncbi:MULTISPECIES: NF038215 family lipoprotein [Acinetobacter]|uniref:NF038215 family lipoprotein n=1 Tax=Acinetobacter geminorum TaxID=2730922 RepID=A0ABT8Z929_9GAMM|nr:MULTISPECIES: NF038215 family lipoprotein [Acinetobacter]MCU4361743.1 NF038215 family lipoprotein [Acinetobacter sp. WU_MDCI_Abxc22]MDO7360875.1 NF038215 family lipoprotein [Acinetobacter geminorum]
MKKLMVSISVVFLILTTGCEMRTTSKQQPANERAMSIAGSPVHEKDYKISDIQVNNHEQSNY